MFKKLFFSILITLLLLLNLGAWINYKLLESNLIKNIQNEILSQYNQVIQYINFHSRQQFLNIQLKDKNIFLEIKKNTQKVPSQWIIDKDFIAYISSYKDYLIIIGENIESLAKLQKSFLESIIYLNFFILILSLLISYSVSKYLLKDLENIVNKLKNFDYKKPSPLKIKAKDKEIQILASSINHFIQKHQEILNLHKEFVQDSSHELKTPLMQALSGLELLEESIENQKQAEKINEIKQSLQKLQDTISKLNFFLKNEETTKKENINLKEIIQESLDKFSNLIRQKNLKVYLDTKDVFINGNPEDWKTIISNLIQNAILYNKENSFLKINLNGKKLIIEDGGIGIKKDELNKIFSRFFRGKQAQQVNNQGSGLGLSIVKKLLDKYQADIKVFSEEGKGTKVEIMVQKH